MRPRVVGTMKFTRRNRPLPEVVETLRRIVEADSRGGLTVRDWAAPGAPNRKHVLGLLGRGWIHNPSGGVVFKAKMTGKRALLALDKLAAEEAALLAASPPQKPVTPRNRPSPETVQALRQVAAAGAAGLTIASWTAPGVPDMELVRGLVRRGWVEHPFGSEIYRVTALGLAVLRQLDGQPPTEAEDEP